MMSSSIAIRMQNIHKIYPHDVIALKDLSLSIHEHDFIALLGPNGAGKSTSIGIICSLIRPTRGSIHIFDHPLKQKPHQAKRCIGLVPQEINMPPFERCIDVLIYQAGYYGIPQSEALKLAQYGLKHLGLWEKRHARVRELSGGMKRRLILLCGLMHQPKILILDEPTAGLDIESRHLIWNFTRELHQNGMTIVLTTHYLEEAEQLCQRIVVINQGSIIEDTTTEQLLQKTTLQTVILTLNNQLTTCPTLPDFSCQLIEPTRLAVDLRKNDTLNTLLAQLSQQHIEVISLSNKTHRLESIFMDMIQTHNDGTNL